ncbi:MAG TPA: Ser-Thr-rich GPI-anchored membrane family protein, partial [Rhodothermales bacterium]|nr:Ser-Thr-rich GPI-anchored membrane family protein [Rhodothermales bacterium]
MARLLRLLPALALLLAAPVLHAQSFQGLGFLDGSNPVSYANDVSADGAVVVGYSYAPSGVGTTTGGAYRWEGAMVALSYPYPQYPYGNYARGVSADGAAVVGYSAGALVEQQRAATRWVGNGAQDVGPPFISEAYAASADGAVVVGQVATRTFRFANGAATVITIGTQSAAYDVSADGEVMVGYAFAPSTRAYRWEDGAVTFLPGLPDYPEEVTEAHGITPDATTIVGMARSGTEPRMARWVDGVIEDLGPGTAYGVSANGTVVVGADNGVSTARRAAIWTAEGGAQDLKTFLEANGLNLAGWTLQRANAVSADGRTIVGDGLNPGGQQEAWRAVLPPAFAVTAPAANEIVRPGETYTVRFSSPGGVGTVDLYLVERARAEGDGERVLLAEDVPAGPGTYDWEVPEDLLSPSTYIVAVDAADASREAVSSRFRVRDPWHLSRVVGTLANPTYEPYVREEHAWSFTQTADELWPRSYWNVDENNYDWGRDPFYTPPVGVAAVRYGEPFQRVTGRY